MKPKSLGYFDMDEDKYPYLFEKDPTKLTHRIVFSLDGTSEHNRNELLMIKHFVHVTRMVHFDIANCFYTMNHDLLPDRLREISSRKIWVQNRHRNPERWVIEPRRGLVPAFETCQWFSQVVMNENPYVFAVMVDDCFCLPENFDAAKNWFIERGFEINNKVCAPMLWTCIINRMSKVDAKCICCGKTGSKGGLACLVCSLCNECDSALTRAERLKFPTCSHCSASAQFRQKLCLVDGPSYPPHLSYRTFEN